MVNETEKFGTVVFDGRIYDLDRMTSEELKELLEKIENSNQRREKEFDSMLGDE